MSLKQNIVFDALTHAYFIFVFCIAYIFYEERILAFDSSFYLFRMIQDQNFDIENGRYSAVLSQLIPVWLIKHGYPLKLVMQWYSSSFVIINYLFFIFIDKVLKDRFSSILLILSLTLFYRFTFYYTVSEVHLAFAPTITLFSILKNWPKNKWPLEILFGVLFIIITIYIVFAHLLFVILIAFLTGYFFFFIQKGTISASMIIGGVLAMSVIVIKLLMIKSGSYDASKIPTLAIFRDQWKHFFDLPSFKFFKSFFREHYSVVISLLLVSFGVLIRKKLFFKSAYFFFFYLFFIILICLTYYKGESEIVQENYWILLGVVTGLLLLEGLFNALNAKTIIFFFTIITSYSCYKIYKCHNFYTERIAYIDRVKQNTSGFPERKFILHEGSIDWRLIQTDWNLGIESIIHSSLISPDSTISFYTTSNINQYSEELKDTNRLVTVDWAPFWFWSNNLNTRYFHLKNTKYRKLNSYPTSDKKWFYDINANKLFIRCLNEYTFFRRTRVNVPVEIINNSKDTVYSIPGKLSPTYLSYHIIGNNGDTIVKEGVRTFLEADVLPFRKIKTGLTIELPWKKGNYKLVVDLISENEKWWYRESIAKLRIQ